MSIGQRRPHQAGDPDELARVLPPPPEFYETTWRMAPEAIAHLQDQRVRRRVREAAQTGFYRRLWDRADFDWRDVDGVDDLAAAPAYTVDDIRDSVERCPPYGDYQAVDVAMARREPMRLFMSGGTTGEPRPTLYTEWDRDVHGILLSRLLTMQGVAPGDVVLNSWTYGTHNGAFAFDEALYRWMNCVVLTTSNGRVTSTRKQVDLAHRFGANALLGTGDYLLHFAEVAAEMGLDVQRDLDLTAISTIGDRAALESTFGLPVLRSYGFHEVGCVAVECPAREGLHVFEDAFVVEVVDPDTGAPLPDGEVGCLVVTELVKTGSAQIRYNIQDLSALYPRGQCACGSWFRRIAPFQGRGDTMVKLRGVNVWPEALGRVATAIDGVGDQYFVRVSSDRGGESAVVFVDATVPANEWDPLADMVARRLREEFGVRMDVEVIDRARMEQLTGLDHGVKARRFERVEP